MIVTLPENPFCRSAAAVSTPACPLPTITTRAISAISVRSFSLDPMWQ